MRVLNYVSAEHPDYRQEANLRGRVKDLFPPSSTLRTDVGTTQREAASSDESEPIAVAPPEYGDSCVRARARVRPEPTKTLDVMRGFEGVARDLDFCGHGSGFGIAGVRLFTYNAVVRPMPRVPRRTTRAYRLQSLI